MTNKDNWNSMQAHIAFCVRVCVGGAIKGIKAGLFQIFIYKNNKKNV